MESKREIERRRYGRVPVKYRVVVHFTSGQDIQGTLLDLSMRGCRIRSEEAATVGDFLEVRIYETEGHEPIHVERAEVRWARDGEFGVKFITVAPAHHERIMAVFKRLAERPP